MRLPFKRTTILYILAGLLLVLVPVLSPPYGLSIANKVVLFSIIAMSLDLLVGYAGLPSIGHAMFFGAGAYAVAILAVHGGLQNFWLLSLAGVLSAGLLAALFGVLVLRTYATYFLMLTLALNQLFWVVVWSGGKITGGNDGLPGIPSIFPKLPWVTPGETSFYYLNLAALIFSFVVLRRIVKAPFGIALTGIRENEARMLALGYPTWIYKYSAWVLSAMFAGLAGALYINYYRFISPTEVHWIVSGSLLFMILVGGAGTLWGSVLGAFITIFLQSFGSIYTQRWAMLLGIAYLLVVLFLRQGIANYLLQKTARLWKS
ncbi:MAG: branched-chain amino acid ABC transporter permease [Chloroflexi bacterium]|nr:branched-chain amino acid ABC transporter permease [Chloroflexota bacterium]